MKLRYFLDTYVWHNETPVLAQEWVGHQITKTSTFHARWDCPHDKLNLHHVIDMQPTCMKFSRICRDQPLKYAFFVINPTGSSDKTTKTLVVSRFCKP